MFKKFFRIGLFRRLSRTTLGGFFCLLGVLSQFLRTGLAYVYTNRRRLITLIKSSLEVLKLVFDVIKNIRNLLFCDQTADFV